MARKKWETAKRIKAYTIKGHPAELYELSSTEVHENWSPDTVLAKYIVLAKTTIGGLELTSVWNANKNGEIVSYIPVMPTSSHMSSRGILKSLGYKLI